jgi:hypothetical protein
VANGQWSPAPYATWTAGTTTTLSCNSGFTSSPPIASMTCGSNGLWIFSGAYATCDQGGAAIVSCPTPNAVQNGAWTTPPFTGFMSGSSTTLVCSQGYTSSSAVASMLCSSSGKWGGDTSAQCTAAQAVGTECALTALPTPPLHGSWSHPLFGGTFETGSASSLVCEDSYAISPANAPQQYITCLSTGSFSASTLTCAVSADACATASLPPVTAGMWMPAASPGQTTYPDGTSVSLMCLQGYTQVPATPVTSLCVNGAFTAASAQCVQSAPPPPPACLSPPTVTAGMWMPQLTPGQTTYSDGATVTLSCLQGYTQVPATLVTSLCVNGAFTAASAQCVKSGGGVVTGGGCAVPAVSTGPTTGTWMVDPSKMSHAKAITGATASLHCNLGYVPSVGGQLTCTANGLWAGSTTAGCIAGGGR